MRLIGLAVVLILTLAAPNTPAAQDSPSRHSLTPAGDMSLLPVKPVFATGPEYRLLPRDDERTDCPRGLQLAAAGGDTPCNDASTNYPRPPEQKRQPRRLLAALAISAELAVSIAKATVPFEHVDFNIKNEGFFGPNTAHGGADKAAHFVDYVIISKEFAYIFEKLGYSENASRWLGVGTAITGGLLNEVGDGLTTNGFSAEDLLMDALGAGTAALLAATRVDDLVGFRSSIMGDHYGHDVYSMDLKLAGLARRLHLNVGPLRYLLFSVTYGVKDYVPGGSAAERQRQIGLEIGLNAEEILIAVGARRDTWWGWALHVVGDNIRFPFTAVGFRYDLNHQKWHGPNSGNFP
jgi:hypothetical protein